MTLSEYLRQRSLVLDPVAIAEGLDPILQDEKYVQEAADLYKTKNGLLTLVIQARVNAIGKHILEDCTPEEVMVLRQSMVEVAAILDDLGRYAAEQERRDKFNESNNGGEEQPKPPVKEGEEGSL